VSNEAGRGDKAAQRRVAWAGYHIMLVLMTLASLTFWFGGEWLMSAFTSDSVVLATAVGLIVPLIFYQLGDATQITFANALRGTSNVMPLLWIALVCYVIIGIPATYILAFPMGLGIYGIVLSFSVSLFSAGALFLATFLRTTKK
jgi:MATE family multidrug resistance protein